MHYTLRSLELPASNPNFGLIYKIVDKLQKEFKYQELPPPIFINWNILQFRYKNTDQDVKLPDLDKPFIYAVDQIKDNDGYYNFYKSTMTSRLNKKINIWGRVCQMVSPVFGRAG